MTLKRRDFLAAAGGIVTASATLGASTGAESDRQSPSAGKPSGGAGAGGAAPRAFNAAYEGEHLEHIAFPLGGIGAGMICLEGAGSLAQMSLRYAIDTLQEPGMFAALSIKGPKPMARVLEGPVPKRKRRPDCTLATSHRVAAWWGLPRFRSAKFAARFPFAETALADDAVPLAVTLTGWSPFEPNDADNASLPVAGLEYTFANPGPEVVEAVFSYNAQNVMSTDMFSAQTKTAKDRVTLIPGGFEFFGAPTREEPWRAGSFAIWVDDPGAQVNAVWSGINVLWPEIERGTFVSRPPLSDQATVAAAIGPVSTGASLFVPFRLAPGESKSIRVHLAWFVERSNLRRNGSGELTFLLGPEVDKEESAETYQPWYVGRFGDITRVTDYWRENYERLRANSARFSAALYDSTLPPEVIEAVAANLTILKSPTVLRQADGRFWAWEGSFERHWMTTEGTNSHVWMYAQALPHLFPALERTIRETEFGPNQREDGHQDFRGALPIRPTNHSFHAAADGQLGGIMKVYRDWRTSGDTGWLRNLWPKVHSSLEYCIRTWDPNRKGWLEEPHHTTYDLELWGPDGMCTGIYLGALQAAILMGRSLGKDVAAYETLLKRGTRLAETELFNGEYFIQNIRWRDLRARYPDFYGEERTKQISPEDLALAEKEGPPDQFGEGCMATGTLGPWMARVCGVGQVLDPKKVSAHLEALCRHNLKRDLSTVANVTDWTVRASFGFGDEGGMLICAWPEDKPKLSKPYGASSEVWTGLEYMAASHLIFMGRLEKGLEMVRICRVRYDGRYRNPFDEVEAGHWYARAMSSYALLQALSGARYDAVDRVLYLEPAIQGDFRSFLSTATGYGTVGVKNGKPFMDVVSGHIPYTKIHYQAAS